MKEEGFVCQAGTLMGISALQGQEREGGKHEIHVCAWHWEKGAQTRGARTHNQHREGFDPTDTEDPPAASAQVWGQLWVA